MFDLLLASTVALGRKIETLLIALISVFISLNIRTWSPHIYHGPKSNSLRTI